MDTDDYMHYSVNYNPISNEIKNQQFLSSNEIYGKNSQLTINKTESTDFRGIYGMNVPSGIRSGGNDRKNLPTTHQYFGPPIPPLSSPVVSPVRQEFVPQSSYNAQSSRRHFKIPENSLEVRVSNRNI